MSVYINVCISVTYSIIMALMFLYFFPLLKTLSTLNGVVVVIIVTIKLLVKCLVVGCFFVDCDCCVVASLFLDFITFMRCYFVLLLATATVFDSTIDFL